ncbi:MAG: iron chelate uptake ABC transporter family permease subunit [Pseudomonadota bacterium]|nr:iron chelate uptake ABC transporter family permease subunit [Pseudomonadota bacterium]
MTIGARGNWDFVLPFRGAKLLALVTVAVAVGCSTVVFQTITANRILTPSIMGFDALYVFLQTGLVFSIGGLGYAGLNPYLKFSVETSLMLVAALALFGAVLRNAADLSRMILTGLIIGIFLRSLTGLMARLIDPNEYSVVQQASFARFDAMNTELTWIAAGITAGCFVWLMARRWRLNVIALGRETAMSLGIDHDRESRRLLVVVSLLVSVATALVGPSSNSFSGTGGFFGLLAAAIAYRVAATWHHAIVLPAASMIAAITLVFGQTLFERLLQLQTSVSVAIEALGGLVFLFLVLRRRTR